MKRFAISDEPLNIFFVNQFALELIHMRKITKFANSEIFAIKSITTSIKVKPNKSDR